jgi:DNA topoisomerase-2
MQKTVIDELINNNGLIKKLKLTSSICTSNMHVFDEDLVIRKVSSPEEIIFRFYKVRKEHYIKRKKYLVDKLNSELSLLDSKVKFIKAVIDEKIIVFNKPKVFVIEQIEKLGGFIKIDNSYDYLLHLKIYTFTLEKIKELEEKYRLAKEELTILQKTSIETMWNSELIKLEF